MVNGGTAGAIAIAAGDESDDEAVMAHAVAAMAHDGTAQRAAKRLQTIFRGKRARVRGMLYSRVFLGRGDLGLQLYRRAVMSVTPRSQAERLGVRPGSVVVSVNGKEPLHGTELVRMLAYPRPIVVCFSVGGERAVQQQDVTHEAEAARRIAACRLQRLCRGAAARARGAEYSAEFHAAGRLGMDIGRTEVTRVVPGGQAAKHGVQVGSRVLAVNDVHVTSATVMAVLLGAAERPLNIRFARGHVKRCKEGVLHVLRGDDGGKKSAEKWQPVLVSVDAGKLVMCRATKKEGAGRAPLSPAQGRDQLGETLDLGTCWVDETKEQFRSAHKKRKAAACAEHSFRVVSEGRGATQKQTVFAASGREELASWLTFFAGVCGADVRRWSDIRTLESMQSARDTAAERLAAFFHGIVARAKGIEYEREFGEGRLGMELDGVIVNRVVPGAQAAEKDVLAGSRVLAIDGVRVHNALDVASALSGAQRPLRIRFTRLGVKRTLVGELHRLHGPLASLKWRRALAEVTEEGELHLRPAHGAKGGTSQVLNLSTCWVNETTEAFRARHTAPFALYSFQIVSTAARSGTEQQQQPQAREVMVLAADDKKTMVEWLQLFDRRCGEQKLGPTLEEMQAHRMASMQKVQRLLRGYLARKRGIAYARCFGAGDLGIELRGLTVNRVCGGGQAEQRDVYVGSQITAVAGRPVRSAFDFSLRLAAAKRPVEIHFVWLSVQRELRAQLWKHHKGSKWKAKDVQLLAGGVMSCLSALRVERADAAFVAQHAADDLDGAGGTLAQKHAFQLVSGSGAAIVFACPSVAVLEAWCDALSRACGKQPPPQSFERDDGGAGGGPAVAAGREAPVAEEQRAALLLQRFFAHAAAITSGREYKHTFHEGGLGLELIGQYVHAVLAGGQADGAVRAGSRIVAVNGVRVSSSMELLMQLRVAQARRPMVLRFARAEKKMAGMLFKLSGGLAGTAWKAKGVSVDDEGTFRCLSQKNKKWVEEAPLVRCRAECLPESARTRVAGQADAPVDAASCFMLVCEADGKGRDGKPAKDKDGKPQKAQLFVLGAARAADAERWHHFLRSRCGRQPTQDTAAASLEQLEERRGESDRQRNDAATKLQGWLRGVVARMLGLEYEREFGRGILGMELQGMVVSRLVPGAQGERLGVIAGSKIVKVNGSRPANAMDVQAFISMARRPFAITFLKPSTERALKPMVLYKLSGDKWKEKLVSVNADGELRAKSLKTEYCDTLHLPSCTFAETDARFRRQHEGFWLAPCTVCVRPPAADKQSDEVGKSPAKRRDGASGKKTGDHPMTVPLYLAIPAVCFHDWLRTLSLHCAAADGAADGATDAEQEPARRLQAFLRGALARIKGIAYDADITGEGPLGIEMTGLVVTRVVSGGNAEKAQIVRGSRVLAINGVRVRDMTGLSLLAQGATRRPLRMQLVKQPVAATRQGGLFLLPPAGLRARIRRGEGGGHEKSKGKELLSLRLADVAIGSVPTSFVRAHALHFPHVEFGFQLAPRGGMLLEDDDGGDNGKGKSKGKGKGKGKGKKSGGEVQVFAAANDSEFDSWWLWLKLRIGITDAHGARKAGDVVREDERENAAHSVARAVRVAGARRRLQLEGGTQDPSAQKTAKKKPKKVNAKKRKEQAKVKHAERRHHHKRRSSTVVVAM
eukprot:g635.t1